MFVLYRDKSIPDLDSLLLDDPSGDLNQLSQLVEKQAEDENKFNKLHADSNGMNPEMAEMECTPPPLCQEFQTARLFLSHFGLLSRLDNCPVNCTLQYY